MSENTVIENGVLAENIQEEFVDPVNSSAPGITTRNDLPMTWEEDGYTVTRTTAWTGPGCHEGCGILMYVKDGKLEKVEGDPEHPYNQGHLCPRCLCLPETIYHKDRIVHPMVRDPKDRGKDAWRQVSWDEALDLIEEKLKGIIAESGPQAIMGFRGTGRDIMWELDRLMYSLGSPHGVGALSGNSCFVPRAACFNLTMGAYAVADCSQHHADRYDHPGYKVPERIFIWGCNPVLANPDWFFGDWIVQCMKRGSKIVTIDPRLTWLSAKSELWLQIRPGTDAALAIAMEKVIVEEELYDKEFVEKWTFGFDRLKEVLAGYDLDELAEATWIPKEKIIKAAHLYAESNNAALQLGVAIDMQKDGVACAQALMSLMALCKNVDQPGGNIIANPPFGISAPGLGGWGIEKLEAIDPGVREKYVVGVDRYPLMKLGMLVDHPDDTLEMLLSGDPYKLRAGIFMGTNPLPNMAQDPERWLEAYNSLEFNVVLDLWMTPTAMEVCDVILPIKTFAEGESLRACLYNLGAINPCIDPVGECKSDAEIVNLIGSRFHKDIVFDSVEECFDDMLSPAGFTYADVQDANWIYPDIEYERYEKGLLRPDGQPGFMTPTGKIELVSTIMESVGHTPHPFFEEPWMSPYSQPELAEEYPFILMSGCRDIYFHSEGRQIQMQREIKPEPVFEIHPDMAAELGISDGDMCWIENYMGRCLQKAMVTPIIHRKMIQADHGWWFPEEKELGGEYGAFGWKRANVNLLLEMGHVGETGFGADIRSSLCKVYKAEKGE